MSSPTSPHPPLGPLGITTAYHLQHEVLDHGGSTGRVGHLKSYEKTPNPWQGCYGIDMAWSIYGPNNNNNNYYYYYYYYYILYTYVYDSY